MEKIHLLNFTKKENLSKEVDEKKIKNKKILLVSPHSDDISISCGGTAYSLSKENEVLPVLFFEGQVKGEKKEKARKIREEEMKKESKVLNLKNPVFLRLKYHNKNNSSFLKGNFSKVEKIFKEFKPDIVFLPKKDDFHPRHRLATKITMRILRKSNFKKTTLFFYESPWSLFNNLEFNSVSLLDKKALSKKLKAIKVHTSQIKRTPLDKIAKNLTELRSKIVPEQRIKGYGESIEEFNKYFVETFIWKK